MSANTVGVRQDLSASKQRADETHYNAIHNSVAQATNAGPSSPFNAVLFNVWGVHMVSVMAFPLRGDSYTDCFYPALQSAGVEVREGICAGRWLVRNLRRVDYVHIHWPSFLYDSPSLPMSLRRFAIFLLLIFLCRVRGAQLIWTVHNLLPHKPSTIPILDRFARWLLVKSCAKFLIHGRSAKTEALRAYPAMKGRTLLVEHGNWTEYYPNSINRSSARKRLDLTEAEFVFLFVGLCAPYKNVVGLVEALNQLRAPATLVIAGAFQTPGYELIVRAATQRSRQKIHIHSGYIPDEELQVYLNASDVVVAPYLDVLTSGTAMLALSFGRPVIAPAMGFLKDVIVDGCGVLYRPSDEDALRDALHRSISMQFDRNHILECAMRHDWHRSAECVADSLSGVCR